MILSINIDSTMIISIILICSLVVIVSLNLYLRHQKKTTNHKNELTIAHISLLKEALGVEKGNLDSIKIEHNRVKFLVKDVKSTDLKLLKGFSKEGLFVKGKEITLTFEFDPKQIKEALEKEV
ncbi:hypothetical protein JN09_000603 [Acholeplasma morum]|uniref:hypothetical protein n=1 Tax=Paracholeplasma morum TaxID=264637 RepID=UPI001956D4EF|nr:hypothetical protein [Paracholeplasma morum]MBM7453278.1 hypothetical protein [Paracholeplasma morum]